MKTNPTNYRGYRFPPETIRQWCLKFGPQFARRLNRRSGQLGDRWHLDEVFVKIRGRLHYLWRAVDQDGDVIDILVQKRRNGLLSFFSVSWTNYGAVNEFA